MSAQPDLLDEVDLCPCGSYSRRICDLTIHRCKNKRSGPMRLIDATGRGPSRVYEYGEGGKRRLVGTL